MEYSTGNIANSPSLTIRDLVLAIERINSVYYITDEGFKDYKTPDGKPAFTVRILIGGVEVFILRPDSLPQFVAAFEDSPWKPTRFDYQRHAIMPICPPTLIASNPLTARFTKDLKEKHLFRFSDLFGISQGC